MKNTFIAFLLFFAIHLFGQDTIPYKFYDDNFQITMKSSQVKYYSFTEFDKNIDKNNLIYYDFNGKVRKYERYSSLSKQILDGVTEELFESGAVLAQTSFVQNNKDGKCRRYWESGTLKREEEYKKGKFTNGKCYAENGTEVEYYPLSVRANFPGGINKFYEYISRNVDKKLIKKTGKIFLTFTIPPSGVISDIKIIRDFGDNYLNNHIINILKKCPKWNPSSYDGELIVTDFAIPLTFTEGQMSTSVQENLEDRRNSNYKSQLIKF